MQLFANNASTTLNGGINNLVTSLVVTSNTNFPVIVNTGDYFYATLSDAGNDTWEIVQVTATSGDTFTVVRGQDNTTALSWITGSVFEMRPVAQGMRDIISYNTLNDIAMSIALG